MTQSQLRDEIIYCVCIHEATGSPAYLEDALLAEGIGVPLVDIQRQLRILESESFVVLAKTMGPTFGVRLTPRGEALLEHLNESDEPGTPPNKIGF